MTVRIAVVQQASVPGAVEENRARALRLCEEALRLKPDVILFHEEMLVGYVPNLRELAEPADGPTTQAFRRLLKDSATVAILGLTERDGDDCYVAAVVVGGQGIVTKYRKTHLWWHSDGVRNEPAHYKPGDRLVTFEVKGFRSGLMICYDGDFPEMTRSYANLGCSMIFWMNNRGSRGHAEVRPLAAANSMIIAASCCCGRDEAGIACPGGSNVTDMTGTLITEIWNDEGVIFADVDPARAQEYRRGNPWYVGRRPDLYVS